MSIQYKKEIIPDIKDIEKLYNDARWYAYTKDINLLYKAFKNSLKIYSAWDAEKLVGLLRLVGDGLTIIYIQDLLVLSSQRWQGIGSKLVKMCLEDYKEVRQKVLLTDESPPLRNFYEKLGFSSCDQGELIAFAKFNNK